MQKHRPFYVVAILLIVISATIPILLLTKAGARTNGSLSPDDAAKVYTTYRFIKSCSEQRSTFVNLSASVYWIGAGEFGQQKDNSISNSAMENGEVFERVAAGGGVTNTDHRVGYIFNQEPSISLNQGEARLECVGDSGTQVGNLLKLVLPWGQGELSDGGAVREFFINAGSHTGTPNGARFSSTSSSAIGLVKEEFKKRFPQSVSNINFDSNTMSPEMSYPQLREAFDVKCNDGTGVAGQGVRLSYIAANGDDRTGNYVLKNTSGRHSVGYGQDRQQATGSREGGSLMDCNRIVEQMNAYAGAYKAAVTSFISSGGVIAPSGGSARPSCESDGGSFVWFLCPFLETMDSLIGYLDNQINSLLLVPEEYYTDASIANIWRRFRDLAYLLLLPAMLLMVIGTALGFQFLDAYTVKRALPRMFAAIIFIALSLPLLQMLITSVNVVGQGVFGLITSVVGGGQAITLAGTFNPSPGQQAGFSLAVIGGLLTFKIWIGFVGFLALSVFLALATIFLLLGFRQLLVVALIVVAPLAVLSWIFPGKEKLWKLWWVSLWKLLLLYPLIMGLLAIGQVFAFIVAEVGPGGLVEVVLKLAAYIGPFFLIPTAFKYAGGVFANIAGITNDREKGAFDRLRKARGRSLEKGGKDALKGNLFKGGSENSLRQRYNKAMQYAAHQRAGGLALRPAVRDARVTGSIADSEFEHALEESEKLPGARAFFANDDLMEGALQGDGDRQAMMQYYRSKNYTDDQARIATEKGLAMRKAMGAQGFALAALAKLPATGTYATEERLGEWHQAIVKATHGDKTLQGSILAAGKSGFRNAQRYEASEAGFSDHFEALKMAADGDSADKISQFIHDKAYKAGGPAAVLNARNDKSAKMFANSMNRDLDHTQNQFNLAQGRLANAKDALANETDPRMIPILQNTVRGLEKHLGDTHRDMLRSKAAVSAVHDQIGSSKQLVSEVLGKEVFGKQVSYSVVDKEGKPITVQGTRLEELAVHEKNPIFQETKHVYNDAINQQLVARGQGTPPGGNPQQPGTTGYPPPGGSPFGT